MRISTPDNLAYPITVTRVLCGVDDEIQQDAVIFSYQYRGKQLAWDADKREDVEREMDMFADFESEVDGTVIELRVRNGQVINGRMAVAEIEELCKHEVQFGGMCANCGKDVTEVKYNQTIKYTDRATVNAVHGSTALLVSQGVAEKEHLDTRKRLLDSQRLSLVVDLDQTIIQATVDPTVGDWQQDPSNPNFNAVKDVQKFALMDPGSKPTWYYIKLRPGLKEFLETISQYYELHVYTMATKSYAVNICKLVDPDGKFFGSRILSRDESGSMSHKKLNRIFPIDTKMVVIIDDRGDVWSWSPNLIKVNVYNFFVGIGDINASFLPKQPELEAAQPKPKKIEKTAAVPDSPDTSASEVTSDSDSNNASPASTAASAPPSTALANGVALKPSSGKDDSLEEKAKEQDEIIAEQLADRPLLQKQKILDAEEQARASPAADAAVELLSKEGGSKELHEQPEHRHNLLEDDDNELHYLQQHLIDVHQSYFEQYENSSAGSKGGRIADLKPGKSHGKKRSVDELQEIPDAADIMVRKKSKILVGVHIVFSGIVPLGVDIHTCDSAICAKAFGATVTENITKRTTHVIASKERRTAKVRQAAKRGNRIAIVDKEWLSACVSQWKHISEDPYRIHTDAQTNGKGTALPDSFEDKGYMLSSSDEEAAQTEDETDGGIETPVNGSTTASRKVPDTDTDVEQELETFGPKDGRRNSHPAEDEREEDWSAIMGEVDDFIGSDTEGESDTESIRSESNGTEGLKTPPSQRKRKREDAADEESRLQKRKKEALARTSSLTNVAVTNGDPGGRDLDKEPDDDDDEEDDGLEAALAAEMERQSEEDS